MPSERVDENTLLSKNCLKIRWTSGPSSCHSQCQEFFSQTMFANRGKKFNHRKLGMVSDESHLKSDSKNVNFISQDALVLF